MPVLLFCIAFGLSMDYEVFLISRIRENWLSLRANRPAHADSGGASAHADGGGASAHADSVGASAHADSVGASAHADSVGASAHADNDRAVALGLARTGRVITAAALVMSISFAALIAAEVSFMRMFGVGLTLAVLVDATLVRMVLVPAFMHLLGGWNWWAPRPLVRLHARIGISESGAEPQHREKVPAAVGDTG
jgi:RND superfamily putative drug exporter